MIEFDRTQGIGGSDVPVIVGLSPYRSALDLWAEKRGETIDREQSLAQRIGQIFEGPIAQLYAEQESCKVVKHPVVGIDTKTQTVLPVMERIYGFPTWSQIDRRRLGKPTRGVEVKHTARLDRFAEGSTPEDVQVQVQHAMKLTGWQSFDVVSLAGGRQLLVATVVADKDVQDAIVEAGREFWQRVKSGEQPPADGSDAAGRYLRERYKVVDPGKIVVATHDMLPLIAEALRWRETKNAAEKQYEAMKQQLMQLMGDAEKIEAPGRVNVTWRDESGDKSWKSIAADYRRLLEENESGIELPPSPEDGDVVGLGEWLDWIVTMHTSAPSRVMRVNGKLLALEGRKDQA